MSQKLLAYDFKIRGVQSGNRFADEIETTHIKRDTHSALLLYANAYVALKNRDPFNFTTTAWKKRKQHHQFDRHFQSFIQQSITNRYWQTRIPSSSCLLNILPHIITIIINITNIIYWPHSNHQSFFT